MLVLVLWRQVRDFIFPLVVSFDLNPLAMSGQTAVCFNVEEFICALWTFTCTFEQTTCFHTPTGRVVPPRHRQGPRYRPRHPCSLIGTSSSPDFLITATKPQHLHFLAQNSRINLHAKYSASHRQALVTPLVEAMTLTLCFFGWTTWSVGNFYEYVVLFCFCHAILMFFLSFL